MYVVFRIEKWEGERSLTCGLVGIRHLDEIALIEVKLKGDYDSESLVMGAWWCRIDIREHLFSYIYSSHPDPPSDQSHQHPESCRHSHHYPHHHYRNPAHHRWKSVSSAKNNLKKDESRIRGRDLRGGERRVGGRGRDLQDPCSWCRYWCRYARQRRFIDTSRPCLIMVRLAVLHNWKRKRLWLIELMGSLLTLQEGLVQR